MAEGDRIWYVEQRGRRWGGTVGKRFKGQEGWRRVRKDDGRQVVAEFLPENRGRVWDVVPGGNREVDCSTGYVSIRQDQGQADGGRRPAAAGRAAATAAAGAEAAATAGAEMAAAANAGSARTGRRANAIQTKATQKQEEEKEQKK